MTHEERTELMAGAEAAARHFYNIPKDKPLTTAAQAYRQGFFDSVIIINDLITKDKKDENLKEKASD